MVDGSVVGLRLVAADDYIMMLGVAELGMLFGGGVANI